MVIIDDIVIVVIDNVIVIIITNAIMIIERRKRQPTTNINIINIPSIPTTN